MLSLLALNNSNLSLFTKKRQFSAYSPMPRFIGLDPTILEYSDHLITKNTKININKSVISVIFLQMVLEN